ncbi:MAG: hypothetical protein QNL62_06485 [Gammaproteobacteria bacterium]|nr:hypothetical protein [Gammaproteobacteria bacterium]
MPNTTSLIRLLTLVSILSMLITSCAKTPDVRLTMCQDLTKLLLNSPDKLEWQEHKPIIKGLDDLEMQIQFAITDASGQTSNAQASCFYKYEQDEIGAETFNTPTSAYSTYPHKMILQGKEINKQLLANSVNKVMILQGNEAIYKAKEGVNKASQKIAEKIKEY